MRGDDRVEGGRRHTCLDSEYFHCDNFVEILLTLRNEHYESGSLWTLACDHPMVEMITKSCTICIEKCNTVIKLITATTAKSYSTVCIVNKCFIQNRYTNGFNDF